MLIFFSILWKKNEVADYEATTFSIFYNNALFLFFIIIMSFYVLKNFTPLLYPFIQLTQPHDCIECETSVSVEYKPGNKRK